MSISRISSWEKDTNSTLCWQHLCCKIRRLAASTQSFISLWVGLLYALSSNSLGYMVLRSQLGFHVFFFSETAAGNFGRSSYLWACGPTWHCYFFPLKQDYCLLPYHSSRFILHCLGLLKLHGKLSREKLKNVVWKYPV